MRVLVVRAHFMIAVLLRVLLSWDAVLTSLDKM